MLSSFVELSQICHKVSAPRHAEAQGESKTVIKSESHITNVCYMRFRFNCRNVDGLLSTTTAVVQLCCYCSTGTCTVGTTNMYRYYFHGLLVATSSSTVLLLVPVPVVPVPVVPVPVL